MVLSTNRKKEKREIRVSSDEIKNKSEKKNRSTILAVADLHGVLWVLKHPLPLTKFNRFTSAIIKNLDKHCVNIHN